VSATTRTGAAPRPKTFGKFYLRSESSVLVAPTMRLIVWTEMDVFADGNTLYEECKPNGRFHARLVLPIPVRAVMVAGTVTNWFHRAGQAIRRVWRRALVEAGISTGGAQ
jgi:hypothetical protein